MNSPGPHSKLAGARREVQPLGPRLVSPSHPEASPTPIQGGLPLVSCGGPPGAEAGDAGGAQARHPAPGAGLSGAPRGFSQKCSLRAELAGGPLSAPPPALLAAASHN